MLSQQRRVSSEFRRRFRLCMLAEDKLLISAWPPQAFIYRTSVAHTTMLKLPLWGATSDHWSSIKKNHAYLFLTDLLKFRLLIAVVLTYARLTLWRVYVHSPALNLNTRKICIWRGKTRWQAFGALKSTAPNIHTVLQSFHCVSLQTTKFRQVQSKYAAAATSVIVIDHWNVSANF